MLGAALLSAFALTGATGPLWSSDLPPRAGQPHVGVSYTGPGTFDCGSSIGRQLVRTTIYKFDNLTICVHHVPAGTAGRKLAISYELTSRNGQLTTIAFGLVQPKLIRR